MNLLRWLRKINRKPARQEAAPRLHLEQLEDRLTPSTGTVLSVAISISPNFFGLNATETVTATVTQQGSSTPVTSGNLSFNLNNQTATAGVNGSGQAIFSTTLPLFAVGTNQTLQVSYQDNTGTYSSSTFTAPVYLNVQNQFLPAQITYGANSSSSTFPTSGGETDSLSWFGFPIKFIYVDPGRIQNIVWGAFTLGGEDSIFFGVPPQLG